MAGWQHYASYAYISVSISVADLVCVCWGWGGGRLSPLISIFMQFLAKNMPNKNYQLIMLTIIGRGSSFILLSRLGG